MGFGETLHPLRSKKSKEAHAQLTRARQHLDRARVNRVGIISRLTRLRLSVAR